MIGIQTLSHGDTVTFPRQLQDNAMQAQIASVWPMLSPAFPELCRFQAEERTSQPPHFDRGDSWRSAALRMRGIHPANHHENRYGEHRMAVFIPDPHTEFGAEAFRQAVTPGSCPGIAHPRPGSLTTNIRVYGPIVQYCPKAKIEIMALQKDQRLHLPSYRNSGADFS
jgi:hypothetical protein